MSERHVIVTDDDVRFVERAQAHYKLFAEASDRQGTEESARTAGILRAQEFYAERLLLRLTAQRPTEEPEG